MWFFSVPNRIFNPGLQATPPAVTLTWRLAAILSYYNYYYTSIWHKRSEWNTNVQRSTLGGLGAPWSSEKAKYSLSHIWERRGWGGFMFIFIQILYSAPSPPNRVSRILLWRCRAPPSNDRVSLYDTHTGSSPEEILLEYRGRAILRWSQSPRAESKCC